MDGGGGSVLQFGPAPWAGTPALRLEPTWPIGRVGGGPLALQLAGPGLYAEGMLRAARSLWTEPAAKHPARAGSRDHVFAAVVLASAVAEALLRPDVQWRLAALAVGISLAAAVWLRRSRPLSAAALAFGSLLVADLAAAVLAAEPVTPWTAAAVLAVLYSLVRWGSGREMTLGAGLVALEYAVAVARDAGGIEEAAGGAAVLLLAAVAGLAVRYRAVARAQLLERARLQEREQLARELHDTVAHHVSAIAIQAQAGLVLTRSPSPASAAEALRAIDREAALALAEMRAMVGGLRDRSGTALPVPGHALADLRSLAAAGDGRLHVDVSLQGNLTGLGPALESTLFRAAQESVTNARRHARGATMVAVAVAGGPAEVQLTVTDDGAGTPAAGPPGFGLVGMAERVRLLGGELTAGPGGGPGWCVHVVLPRERRAVP